MYRYKTIRSPPITNNVTFELTDETIVLRIIVDAKNVQLDFDISTETKNIDILKKIKFLLKDKGMTISGAKKQLNEDFFDIDANENKTINALNLKFKLNKINKLLKNLKTSNGKKNTR